VYTSHLQAALTGQPSPVLHGLCSGQNLGDNIARGYITADTVNNCTLRFPGDLGYFAPGGTGFATNQNVIWGDWFIVNTTQNFAQGGTLVHIEAAPGIGTSGPLAAAPRVSGPGVAGFDRYAFYGRYVGWRGADAREPL